MVFLGQCGLMFQIGVKYFMGGAAALCGFCLQRWGVSVVEDCLIYGASCRALTCFDKPHTWDHGAVVGPPYTLEKARLLRDRHMASACASNIGEGRIKAGWIEWFIFIPNGAEQPDATCMGINDPYPYAAFGG